MYALRIYKASSMTSIVMVLIAAVVALLMIWVDLSGTMILRNIWLSIATLFFAAASVSIITREVIRTTSSKTP
jgi:hypothetical protein|tara:strand:- start:72 stop:290 length:219 start_codon:yes stop_codon:yes gene_type:complete